MQRVVVVGAGLAGLQTVVALRSAGFAGRLSLVGAEDRAPYDLPPLSKAMLSGAAENSSLEADWAALDVDLRLGERALRLADGTLQTDRGTLAWDGLVLAVGAEPARLPGGGRGAGAGSRAVLTLRTHDDAVRLRSHLLPGARLVIVGAGWIAAEVATAAVAAGVEVTVLEAARAPFAAALPEDVGARLALLWSAIDLRLNSTVAIVESTGVSLVGGERVAADVVLIAVGARPATAWLAGSGVALAGRAVAVDSHLRSTMPGVLAVGDCAGWESARYGTRLLVEHWDNALHAPSVAAANLLGGTVVYDPVPYFWSEQWARMVQYAGHHPAGDRLVWRDGADGSWAVFWLAVDRLVAALTVDRPRDLVQARRLMASGASVDATLLVDQGVPVKACI